MSAVPNRPRKPYLNFSRAPTTRERVLRNGTAPRWRLEQRGHIGAHPGGSWALEVAPTLEAMVPDIINGQCELRPSASATEEPNLFASSFLHLRVDAGTARTRRIGQY